MREVQENSFLSVVFKYLNNIKEVRGKEDSDLVATSTMHIVCQYPRFLKSQWSEFTQAYIYNLLELMHDTAKDVQEMACVTFLKLAKSLGTLTDGPNDTSISTSINAFVEDLVEKVPDIICNLKPYQVLHLEKRLRVR